MEEEVLQVYWDCCLLLSKPDSAYSTSYLQWLDGLNIFQDTQDYLDKVELRGKIRGLREWQEGYEELEAIPCSFAIEFKDFSNDWGTWSMYTDSEEEKVHLIL